jgi:hypothetical protein
VKFILFVEDHTEKKALPGFFKRWLDPKLRERVGIKVVRFEGCAELWRDGPQKARLYLEGPGNQDIIAVISLLDLYGLDIFPYDIRTAQDRYTWAKVEMEIRVDHPKFHQFFAVHETEAWLLSEPEIFPAAVKNALSAWTASPENINFDEPPSKLLDRLYRNKLKQTYKKTTHGKQLFDNLDPALAYAKCPRLKEMLDEMLEMAGGSQT